jgi:hypothetical protein
MNSEFDIPLNYPNRLPNFHNTFPMLHYSIYEDGPILITKRQVRLRAGSWIGHQEMKTESIDHIMSQIIAEYEWESIGIVSRI